MSKAGLPSTWASIGIFSFGYILAAAWAGQALSSDLGLDLGLQGEHYFSEGGVGQNEVTWFSFAEANIHRKWIGEKFEARIFTDFTLPLRDPSFTAYSPKENYVSWGRSMDSIQVSLGQKILPFSEMDRRWELGLWQPRKRLDPVHTEQEGVLGFFFEGRTTEFRASGYFSPVSLPELGVPSEVREGRFFSPYPMFSAPSSEIDVLGVPTPVFYTVQEPKTWTFIRRNNGGGVLELGKEKEGPLLRLSYAYQTIPQILVGFTGGLGFGGSLREARVTIYPRRADHHLAGMEAGFSSERWRVLGSAVQEWVKRDVTPASWNTQEIPDQTRYFALMSDMTLWGKGPDEGNLELMGFKRVEDEGVDRGPLLTGEGNLFDPRAPFSTAVSARLRYALGGGEEKVRMEHRWIRDIPGLSDGWSTSVAYSPVKKLQVYLGMDFLRTLRPRRTEDILSIYREQDRVYFGVRYAL